MDNVAVLGAGNGGVAMAAYISLLGYEVNLYDKYEQAIEDIKKTKEILLKGVDTQGKARLHIVTDQLEEAIENCSIIMVVTPAFAHKEIAEKCARTLTKGQIVILHPGRTGGALEFRQTVLSQNPNADFTVGEAQTLIYACRRTGSNEATIYGVKKEVLFAALPSENSDTALNKLNEIYPQFKKAKNVLETSLFNIGAIFHPVPTLLNVGRIESIGSFDYYHEGITPSIAGVLEKIDLERMEVAKAFGIVTPNTVKWLETVYGAEGEDIYSAVQNNSVYAGIKAPNSMDNRYVLEDVPMSLVPICQLGKLAGVPTPTMNAFVQIANAMYNRDFIEEGRNLKNMGLEKMLKEDLIKMVN